MSKFKMSLIKEYGLEASSEDDGEGERNLNPLAEAMLVMKMARTDGSPAFIYGHEGLAIGSIGCAYNEQALVNAGITHILTLTKLSRLKFPEIFIYKRVPMRDSMEQTITDVLAECFEFIDNALASPNGKVLVHCYKGISRCATVCVAYLMSRHGMSSDDALALIRHTRPQACPNIHFIISLRLLEKSNTTEVETLN